jgi:hypothetical protein
MIDVVCAWCDVDARVFYRLKRAKYLVCNIIYDATLKIIAVVKVKANIVTHICSSIAWQAGAQPVSQPPAPAPSARADTGNDLKPNSYHNPTNLLQAPTASFLPQGTQIAQTTPKPATSLPSPRAPAPD